MRDLLLTLILVPLLPVSIKYPFAGAMAFAWLSLMNPHRFTWGFAFDMPWAQLFAIVTIIGLALREPKLLGESLKQYWIVLLYLAWMTITTLFAVEPEEAHERYAEVLKTHVMCFVTLALLSDRARVRWLVLLATLSIAFYGVKGGLFTLLVGGEYLVWGPVKSAIADNNALAAALVVILPLTYWIYATAPKAWMRWATVAGIGLIVASIFGSGSRGAFLALCAMSGVFLMKAKHKVLVFILGIFGAAFGLMMMPDKYWDRIQTISTFDQDPSAMGRINTWITAFRIANDRLTGAGFEYYGPTAFSQYAPDPNAIHSSHSIYFQALGEHGWIGFILYVGILLIFWSRARRLIRSYAHEQKDSPDALLARMLQVSLVGFMVAGSFVNIGNWDFFYYLFIIITALVRLREQERRQPIPKAPSFVRPGAATASAARALQEARP